MNDTEFMRQAERIGARISPDQMDRLRAYEDHLWTWSERVRLVSRMDRDRLREHHLLESLSVVPHLPEYPLLALDLGTGGGLPGIPIKIARPDIRIVLLEPARMKALFLKSVLERLGLAGLEFVRARAEEIASDGCHRGHYRIVLARGVAPLPALWDIAAPLLDASGRLFALKGPGALAEFPQPLPSSLVFEERALPEIVPGRRRALIAMHRQHTPPGACGRSPSKTK